MIKKREQKHKQGKGMGMWSWSRIIGYWSSQQHARVVEVGSALGLKQDKKHSLVFSLSLGTSPPPTVGMRRSRAAAECHQQVFLFFKKRAQESVCLYQGLKLNEQGEIFKLQYGYSHCTRNSLKFLCKSLCVFSWGIYLASRSWTNYLCVRHR